MDQKTRDDNHQEADRPIYRAAVRTMTNRCRTHESVGRSGCIVGVKREGENRGRGADGQGDRGGRDDVANRVRGIVLGGIEERDESRVVVGAEEVDEDDDECGDDVIDIHGGRIWGVHRRVW